MPKNVQGELKEFLATKPAWMRRILQEDYSSFTPEELRAWFSRQSEVNAASEQYERILRKAPAMWNAYAKKANRRIAQTEKLERHLLGLPKGLPGAPRTDEITSDAVALKKRGKKFRTIANSLTEKYSERYSEKNPLTPEAVRKRIERASAARTKGKK